MSTSLEAAEPDLPEGIDDRAADLWEPLLAIADAAGGNWPDRARKAALVLSRLRLRGEPEATTQLLKDLRSITSQLQGDRFPSRVLLAQLVAIEASPWSEWKRGRPLTPRGLADLLATFDLTPSSIRLPSGSTPKGYKREDLERLFSVYLDPPEESATPPPRLT